MTRRRIKMSGKPSTPRRDGTKLLQNNHNKYENHANDNLQNDKFTEKIICSTMLPRML